MKKEKSGVGPLLTDEQLGSLGSWAEYSDQELVVDEFLEEAKRVSAAIAADRGDRFNVDPGFMTPAVRALVAMRAFYFLGVLRGGEAYRKCIGPEGQRRQRRVFQGDPYFLEHEEERWNREPVPLELQNTFYFLDSLYSLPREELRKLLEMLGLSTEKKEAAHE